MQPSVHPGNCLNALVTTAPSPGRAQLRCNKGKLLLKLRQWCRATWQDYDLLRDVPGQERVKLAFDRRRLWVDMGGSGINHSD